MNNSPPPMPNAPKQCGLALASLILGLTAVVACLGFLTGIPAVICGHKALSRIRRSNKQLTGEGLALGGLATGYFGTVVSLILIPVVAFAITRAVKQEQERNRARQSMTRSVGRSSSPTRKNAIIYQNPGNEANVCIANLRRLAGAKDLWALDNKKNATDTPTMEDLVGPDKLVKAVPTCPGGGTYTLGTVETKPTCSVPGHKLD